MVWEGRHGGARPGEHGKGGRIVAAGDGSDSGVFTRVCGHADGGREERRLGAPRLGDV